MNTERTVTINAHTVSELATKLVSIGQITHEDAVSILHPVLSILMSERDELKSWKDDVMLAAKRRATIFFGDEAGFYVPETGPSDLYIEEMRALNWSSKYQQLDAELSLAKADLFRAQKECAALRECVVDLRGQIPKA